MSSKSRKNYSVAAMLFRVNHISRFSKSSPDYRRGMQGLLETVLHATGNYKGFGYLSVVPTGHAPGINLVGVALANASQAEMFEGTDPTRITYYVSTALQADYDECRDMQEMDVEKRKTGGDTDAEKWLCTQIGA